MISSLNVGFRQEQRTFNPARGTTKVTPLRTFAGGAVARELAMVSTAGKPSFRQSSSTV